MTTSVRNKAEELETFSRRFAKKWKNYFSIDGLIPGIEPTNQQKQVVQSNEKQLIIRGSAGSGKSLMLAYRLIKVMEQSNKPQRILYVTFNETLIQDTVKRLCQSETYNKLKEKHHVDIRTYHDLVRSILMKECGYPEMKRIRMTKERVAAHESLIDARLEAVLAGFEQSEEYEQMEKLFKTHTAQFLREEFFWMKANGLITKEKYFEKERTGRGNSPSVNRKQRPTIFYLFELYNAFMLTNFQVPQYDMEDYALLLLNELNNRPNAPFQYDHIFVDEFQDLQPMQIKSLVELTNNSITLVGDDKQRIYKRTPVSYRELNLQITARKNQKLSKNFRSTKQIMNLASSLQFDDVENVREDDQDFFREGDPPNIMHYKKNDTMFQALVKRIKAIHETHKEKTIAVIHRYTKNELNQEDSLLSKLHREFHVIDVDQYGKKFDYNKRKKPIFFTDPFEIKGLEFDYVFILHFDREHYPSQQRIEELNDKYGGAKTFDKNYENDYDAILNDEKKLLYVACSRARHELNIFYVAPKQLRISPFVRDFRSKDYKSNFGKRKYSDKK
ncbi:UvrD-helicase domain-containing protein [Oceanobacillus halotolerans]|uniref:UvrD-helicase domain-containing protein n=1 Tax=Oceanobacillus halotolerans TaxID=2663380 RepID=UPI0013D8E5A9|nr:UvrD-helicase domain-containing protein [Oceanobacillus halotolerans]